MKIGWKPSPGASRQAQTAYHQALPGRTAQRSGIRYHQACLVEPPKGRGYGITRLCLVEPPKGRGYGITRLCLVEPTKGRGYGITRLAWSNRPKAGGTTAYHQALPGRTGPRSVARRRITRLCLVEPTQGRWHDGVSPGSAWSNRPKAGGTTAYHQALPGRTDRRSVTRRLIVASCQMTAIIC